MDHYDSDRLHGKHSFLKQTTVSIESNLSIGKNFSKNSLVFEICSLFYPSLRLAPQKIV